MMPRGGLRECRATSFDQTPIGTVFLVMSFAPGGGLLSASPGSSLCARSYSAAAGPSDAADNVRTDQTWRCPTALSRQGCVLAAPSFLLRQAWLAPAALCGFRLSVDAGRLGHPRMKPTIPAGPCADTLRPAPESYLV